MAYRRDLDALEARHAALEAELATKRRERDQVGEMLHDAHEQERAAIVQADIDAGGPEWRRRRVIHVVIVVFAVVALAIGLGRYTWTSFHVDNEAQRTLSTFERSTAEMCACQTRTCADAINDRVNKWEDMQLFYSNYEPTRGQAQHFEALIARYGTCRARLSR